MGTKYENLLEDGSGNIIQSFYDNFEKSQAEFRNKAGFRMTVFRESIGVCCPWCQDLVGTWDYDSRPSDVYARHKNCTCIVYTKTERGTYQDAWSRKEYDSQRDARIAREKEIIEEQKQISEQSRKLHNKQDIYNYGMGAININEEYIASQEYRMKYHGITGDHKIDDKIYEYAKEILENKSGSVFEELVLLDADTGDLILAIRDSKIENKVVYTQKIESIIKSEKKKGRNIIAIHNHPEGYPPTADDAVSALVRGYNKGVVCGHNGKLYTYEPSRRKYSKEELEEIHSLIVGQYVQGDDIDKYYKEMLHLFKIDIETK